MFYDQFRAYANRVGMPKPFKFFPFDYDFESVAVQPFGANAFAFTNHDKFYSSTAGMHNGFDYILPTKTPILAVADGLIVTKWPFMKNQLDKTVCLWPFTPEGMSNVLVAYAHLSAVNVTNLQRVEAGDTIGLSGFPPSQPFNAHLHYEVHFISGDKGYRNIKGLSPRRLLPRMPYEQQGSNQNPYNPVYFNAPFLNKRIEYMMGHNSKYQRYPHPSLVDRKELDMYSLLCYEYSKFSVWQADRRGLTWAEDIDKRMGLFEPYQPIQPPESF